MSEAEDPNEATAEDGDLLGGLESLLDEEGSGLDLPDDDELGEDELTDLFADDDEEELAPQQIRSRIRRRYRNHVDPAADPEGLRENQPTGTRSWQRPAGLDRSNQGRSAHLCHHSAPGELRQLRIQGGDFAGRSCRHSAGQERCSRSRRQRLGA